MRKIVLLLFVLMPVFVSAQKNDFELLNTKTFFFDKIQRVRNASVDSVNVHSGKYSLRVSEDKSAAIYPLIFDGNATEICVKGYYLSEISSGMAIIEVSTESKERYPMNHIITSSFTVNDNSDGWRSFEIKVPLCPQVVKCSLYFMTKGEATIWIDDIEVLMDSKQTNDIKQVIISKVNESNGDENSKFEISTPLNEQQINDLASLCHQWGELKYSHPSVKRGKYDWDAVLFELLPMDAKKREKHLNTLLANETIEDSPYSYYINPVAGLSLAYFKNEKSYPKASYSDAGVKLLGVFRLWNAIENYYPYRNLVKDWDSALKCAIEEVVKANNAYEYQIAIMGMLGAIEDSHAVIEDPESALFSNFGSQAFPFVANKFVDNRFVVDAVMTNTDNLQRGDVIVAIGDQTVEDFVNKNKKYLSYSNQGGLLSSMASYLISTSKDKEKFRIERDGKQENVEVKSVSYQKLMDLAKDYRTANPLKKSGKLDEKIFYININDIDKHSIATVAKEVKGFENVIVDMRGYPETQGIISLLEQLMPKCGMVSQNIKLNSSKPKDFIVCAGDYFGRNNNDAPKKVAVLVNENTQSQSEYLTMMLQAGGNATVIGSQTSGTDGNVTSIDLPYGITAKFTGIGILYPDGGQTQRVGVKIDEIVKLTIKGIIEGRDEVLERAIDILNLK